MFIFEQHLFIVTAYCELFLFSAYAKFEAFSKFMRELKLVN